jgi:hypothetical protein
MACFKSLSDVYREREGRGARQKAGEEEEKEETIRCGRGSHMHMLRETALRRPPLRSTGEYLEEKAGHVSDKLVNGWN